MAYKITKDSLKAENGYTRMKVKFFTESGIESEEQFFEVQSLDKEAVEKALEYADQSFENACLKTTLQVAPTLQVDKKVSKKVETKVEVIEGTTLTTEEVK